MRFSLTGRIVDRKTIATGSGIREIERLKKAYGDGRWRKCKGRAKVRFDDGTVRDAEVHWYEAHGIGRRGIKRILN